MNKIFFAILFFAGLALMEALSASAATSEKNQFADQKILGRLHCLDQVESERSQLALQNAKSDEVQEFARLMVTSHNQHMQDVESLAKNQSIKMDDSEPCRAPFVGANPLNAKKDEAFDASYLNEQIRLQEKVMDLLDKKMIPTASNEELRAMLVNTRQAVVTQLARAKALKIKY